MAFDGYEEHPANYSRTFRLNQKQNKQSRSYKGGRQIHKLLYLICDDLFRLLINSRVGLTMYLGTWLGGGELVDKITLSQHIRHDGHVFTLALKVFYDWVEEMWGENGNLLDSFL